jgi:hypothetical protein
MVSAVLRSCNRDGIEKRASRRNAMLRIKIPISSNMGPLLIGNIF